MEAKFTKGPWRWEVNKKHKNVDLCGSGIEVLRFQRYGMQSAQPTFTRSDDTFKLQGEKASDLAVDIKGREHHSDWCQTIDHPDAHLISAAPDLYEALDNFDAYASTDVDYIGSPFQKEVRAALAKARGENVQSS